MSRPIKQFLASTCMSAAIMAIAVGNAYANPQDGVVSAGSANITSSGNTLNIHQSSQSAVIDWRSFDIGASETTRFYQPSSSSVTLNRVNSSTPSFIDGNLIANGNIFIINQNGVLFGANSRVDVNGLVATTANITDANFMAGNFRFDQAGNPDATIENRGQITAGEAGLIGLVAPNVLNSGIIHAKLGRVHLASGDTATVDLYGDGLIEVGAGDYTNQRTVVNTGKITAEGGTIAMTASAGATMVNSLIRVSGELHAPSVGVKNGKIIIGAEGSNAVAGNVSSNKGKKSGTSKVIIDGVVEASGKDPGEKGGTITITADQIALMSTAVLDASGAMGGGTVHIGGQYLGLGETPTAEYTIIQTGALIDASATEVGNGGEVVVFADKDTQFGGTIIADGAGDMGNGGFAETSGKRNLLAMGTVQLRAGRRGNAGTWLLDPADITITTSTNTNITGSPNFTATGTGSQVSAANIKTILDAGTNVTIVTNNDAYAGNGDIFVNSAITTTGAGSLTLSAYRNITVSSSITLSGGGLTLRSDNTGAGSGQITVTAAIATNGGNIIMGGGSGAITAGSGFAVGNDATYSHGIYINSTVAAGGGNIIMNGTEYTAPSTMGSQYSSGVAIDTSANINTTGTGTISITGTSASATVAYQSGVGLSGIISVQNGDLTVTGSNTGSASSAGNLNGIGVGAATITSTGTGRLIFNGTNNTTNGSTGAGLRFMTSAALTSANGNILATGNSTTSYGVFLTYTNSITLNGAADLYMTGTGTTDIFKGGAVGITTVTGSTSANDVIITANTLNVDATNYLGINTLGSTTFQNRTAGTTVGVGSGAGTLSVVNTTLSHITSGTYIFGSTTSGDVTFNTTNDFNTKNLTLISGNDILVTGNIAKSTGAGTANYLLQAYRNINISAGAGITATTGSLNITLQSDYNADNDGSVLSFSSISSNGGNITMGGGSGTITAGSGYAVGNSVQPAGIFLSAGVNAGGGNIIMNGSAYSGAGANRYGIYTSSNVATTGSGTITMNGIGTGYSNAGFANIGVWIVNGGNVSTQNGLLSITGVDLTTGTGSSWGVYISPAGTSTVRTTGSGDININGTARTTSGGTAISTTIANAIQATGTGNIVLKAIAGYTGMYATVSNAINTASGNITIYSDGYVANASSAISAGGILNLNTYTNKGMSLGTNVAGTTNIDNTTLGNLSAGTGFVFGSILTGTGANNTSDVTINTTRDFGAKNVSFIAGGNILLDGTLTKATGAGTATYLLRANGNITNTALMGILATTGSINLTLNSDYDQATSAGGYVTLNGGTFNTNGGAFTIGGGLNPLTGNSFNSTGDAVSLSSSSTITTGAGNISIRGASTSSSSSIGVNMLGAITTTSGTISIYGASSSNNSGSRAVLLNSGGTITSGSGNITVTGYNNSGNSGAYAVLIYNTGTTGSTISSTSGNITIDAGRNSNETSFGLSTLNTATPALSTTSGNITILTDTKFMSATGTQMSAVGGTLTIAPKTAVTMSLGSTSGTLNITNAELALMTASNYVFGSTAGDNLTVTTTRDFGGGNVTFISGTDIILASTLTKASGAGTANYIFQAYRNIYNTSAAAIQTTTGLINLTLQSDYDGNSDGAVNITGGGISTNGGNITIGGGSGTITAGSGYAVGNSGNTRGIYIGASVSAAGGNIIMNGKSYLSTSSNIYGFQNVSAISTTGAGTISLSGISQGSGNAGQGYGTYIQAAVTAVNGNITIAGQGGGAGTGADNYGTVFSSSGGYARTSGTGNIIVTGTGGTGTGGNHIGILGNYTTNVQTTGSGTISLTGVGGASAGGSAAGISLNGAITGNGGAITLTGTGGAGAGGTNAGVSIGTTAVGSVTNIGTGTITINGTGGGITNSGSNYGVYLYNGSTVSTVNGALNITGIGGGAGTGSQNYGVDLVGALSSVKTTGSGAITIIGTGGNATGSGTNNHGVIVNTNNNIQSQGTGTITITGTGSNASGGSNLGIHLLGGISSVGGAVNITGTGGSNTGNGNDGVRVNAGTLTNTGTGTITVNGTGGGTGASSSNYGVWVVNAGVISTVNGALNVTGTGGLGSGGSSHGIGVTSVGASTIKTTGSGSISLTGITQTGSSNALNIFGVANGVQTTGTGNISLYGNSMAFNTASAINSIGSLTIASLSGITMGVGSGAGTLGLTDALLGYTTAASYILGATNIGDMVINSAFDFANKNVTFLSGGNITLAGTLTKATGTGTANYLLQANGNITNSGGAGVTASAGAINLTLTSDNDISGAGNISFASSGLLTNNGTITMNSNGQSITLSGTIGGTTTLNSSNGAVSLGSIDGTTASTKDLIVNAGTGTLTTTSQIGATNKLRDFTITANDVVLGANMAGSGTLTIQSTTVARDTYVARGTADGTNLNISATEIGYMVDGWGNIYIGRTNGSGSVYIGTTAWVDPITFRNNYRVDMGGALTATGDASVNFVINTSGWLNQGIITTQGQNVTVSGGAVITGANNITTNGGSISVGPVQISGSIASPTWSTSGGNITIGSTMVRNSSGGSASTRTFTLNAGTGNVTFGGTVDGDYSMAVTGATITLPSAWGATEALGDITLNSTNSITLRAMTTAAGKTVAVNVSGAGNSITTTGAISTGAAGNVAFTADDLTLGANLSGTGTITLQPYANTRAIKINSGTADGTILHLSTAEIAYLVDGWSQINIGKASGSSAYIDIGASTWVDPLNIRGWYSRVAGALAGTGNASISFNGTSAEINTTGSAVTTQGQAIYFLHGIQSYSSGASPTIKSNGGNITITEGINVITPNYGTFSVLSGGGNISIGNASGAILPGTLTTGSYNLDAGAGTLTLGGTVNTAGNVTANAATINTSAAWGGSTALGNVTITSANALSLPAITTAAGKTLSVNVTGAGNALTTTGAISTGTSGNISLSADDLILGGNLSGTGTLTLQPNSTTRTLNVNRGVADGTNFNLSTAEIAYFVDGWSLINIGNSGNSVTSYLGVATWSDPVNFRSAAGRIVYANTGTGNASFTFSGASSWVDLYGDIITNGGVFDLSNANYLYMPLTGAATKSISTSGGNVSLKTVYLSNSNLSINTGAGSINFGGAIAGSKDLTASANSMTFSGAWGASPALGSVSLTSVNSLTLPTISASSLFVQTTGATSDITIGSGKTLTASASGNAITLVSARNFINGSGSATPFVLTGGGRWLTYSTNPTNDALGGMTSDFVRYGCTYGGSCPSGVTIPSSGNGTIYTYRPTITLTPTVVALTYGDAIPSLTGYAYAASGYLTSAAGNDSGLDSLTGTLTGTTTYTQGSDIGNYNINYNSGTVASALGYIVSYANNANAMTVAKRTLIVSLTGAVNKVYDGNNAATLSSANYSLSNFYGSDAAAVTVATTAGLYDDKNVNTNKQVSVSGLTLTGTQSNNYQLSSTSLNANIGNVSQKDLYIAGLSGVNRVYDGTKIAGLGGTAALSGDVAGDDVLIAATGVGEFGDKNVGTAKAITVSGFTISGNDANNYNLIQPTALTANVTKATLTVAATASGKTYNGNDITTATLSDDRISGDVLTVSYANANFDDKDAGAGKNVTVSGINVTGTDAGNYNFNTTATTTADILKKSLVVTANNQMVTYGTAVSATTLSYNGFIAGEDASFLQTAPTITSAQSGIVNAGTYANNYTVSGGADNNYSMSYVYGNLTINKKTLNVTADDRTVTYGVNAPGTTTLTYNGFITGEDATNLTVAPTAVSALSGRQNAGTYAGNYTVSGGVSGNYDFAYFSGDLNVSKRNLAVSADNQSISYGTVVPTGSLTYSGFVSGEDETVLDVSPTVASGLSGVQNVGSYAGNYTVGGGTDNNYNLIYSSGALTVTAIGVNVIVNNRSVIYGTSVPTSTLSYSGFINGDTSAVLITTPTITSAQSGIVNAGTYAGNYTASGASAANYYFNYISGDLTVGQKVLNVTAGNRTITYGDAIPASALTYTGFISGEDVTFLTSAPTVTSLQSGIANVGTYGGNFVVSGGVSNNYSFNYVNGSLNVVKKNLIVTADSRTISYGAVVPGTTTLSYNGFVNSENASVIDTAPVVSSTLSGVQNAGTYTGNYTVGGATDNNYSFTYVAGNLVIVGAVTPPAPTPTNPDPPTVSDLPNTFVYTYQNPVPVATFNQTMPVNIPISYGIESVSNSSTVIGITPELARIFEINMDDIEKMNDNKTVH